MRVLITGSDGFLAKNLRLYLSEQQDVNVFSFSRQHNSNDLPVILEGIDFVFHLAGVNRPQDPKEFETDSLLLTRTLCSAVTSVAEKTGRKIPILLSSSIQAVHDNPYGKSKLGAEEILFTISHSHGIPVHIFRLPNVFGKWCRPNYNSAIATFCHNIARDLPIQVHDQNAPMTLAYVDDVVEHFVQVMHGREPVLDAERFVTISPQYDVTVGEVARLIRSFRDSRDTLLTERVGTGLVRALYATYVSYLPTDAFSYEIPQYGDSRGVFTEMLKTPDCGQFSYFTAHPGVTRGGHYHHSKTEKFLVIKGRARFKFRHMLTDECYELITSGDKAEIVQTVTGWTHDITNIGTDEMVVMLWANEIFDRARPDTYSCPV